MIQKTALLLMLMLLMFPVSAETAKHDPFALIEEFSRLKKDECWPGFDPSAYPVAVYDGERTLLFKHPHPPEGFTALEDRPHVAVWQGQHPMVKGNTSIDMGGITAATVLLNKFEETPLKKVAAVVAHECFHVFQKGHFPNRWPNSTEVFLYPVEDTVQLRLKRLETEALRRSFDVEDSTTGKPWLALALKLHAERMELLPVGSRDWERGVEFIEGTARYVESVAAGEKIPLIPEDGYAADKPRYRAYSIGYAWAVWLDRLVPDWKRNLKEVDPPWLDVLLTTGWKEHAGLAEFSNVELDAYSEIATRAVGEIVKAKEQMRSELLARAGWKLIIECPAGRPLWPSGFDPMNVKTLNNGEVLHTRWLTLKNETGEFEVNGTQALTEPAGEHPLFTGVSRVTVTGIGEKPELQQMGETVSFDSGTISFKFAHAKWKYEDETLTIYPLGPKTQAD